MKSFPSSILKSPPRNGMSLSSFHKKSSLPTASTDIALRRDARQKPREKESSDLIAELEEVQRRKERLRVQKKKVDVSDVVEINAGGNIHHVKRDTLCLAPDTMFSSMFDSGSNLVPRDGQGRIFLDHDPSLIESIINYLRLKKIEETSQFSSMPEPIVPKGKMDAFKCLLDHFGLTPFFYPKNESVHSKNNSKESQNDDCNKERSKDFRISIPQLQNVDEGGIVKHARVPSARNTDVVDSESLTLTEPTCGWGLPIGAVRAVRSRVMSPGYRVGYPPVGVGAFANVPVNNAALSGAPRRRDSPLAPGLASPYSAGADSPVSLSEVNFDPPRRSMADVRGVNFSDPHLRRDSLRGPNHYDVMPMNWIRKKLNCGNERAVLEAFLAWSDQQYSVHRCKWTKANGYGAGRDCFYIVKYGTVRFGVDSVDDSKHLGRALVRLFLPPRNARSDGRDLVFQCPKCSATFGSKQQFIVHLARMTSGEELCRPIEENDFYFAPGQMIFHVRINCIKLLLNTKFANDRRFDVIDPMAVPIPCNKETYHITSNVRKEFETEARFVTVCLGKRQGLFSFYGLKAGFLKKSKHERLNCAQQLQEAASRKRKTPPARASNSLRPVDPLHNALPHSLFFCWLKDPAEWCGDMAKEMKNALQTVGERQARVRQRIKQSSYKSYGGAESSYAYDSQI